MHKGLVGVVCAALGAGACGGSEAPGDVVLAPPQSLDVGFQKAIEPFEVPAGEEIQNCYFFEVPYDTPTHFNSFVIGQNTGTHHVNVFRVKTIKDLSGKPGDVVTSSASQPGPCFVSSNWSDWPIVTNNQGTSDPAGNQSTFTLPDGVGSRFEAHELLMLQVHYVNATIQPTPGHARVAINFMKMPDANVQAELGTVFATNQNIRACPGDKDRSYDSTCRFARSAVKIVGANGHYHNHGVDFQINVFDSTAGKGAMFYDSSSWDDPLFAKSLAVDVPADGGISFTCKYTVGPTECGNANDSCCYTFGGHVTTQEHCNAFVYYYPRNTTDVNCF